MTNADARFNLWSKWRDDERLRIWNIDVCYGSLEYLQGRLRRLDEAFKKNVLRALRPEAL